MYSYSLAYSHWKGHQYGQDCAAWWEQLVCSAHACSLVWSPRSLTHCWNCWIQDPLLMRQRPMTATVINGIEPRAIPAPFTLRFWIGNGRNSYVYVRVHVLCTRKGTVHVHVHVHVPCIHVHVAPLPALSIEILNLWNKDSKLKTQNFSLHCPSSQAVLIPERISIWIVATHAPWQMQKVEYLLQCGLQRSKRYSWQPVEPGVDTLLMSHDTCISIVQTTVVSQLRGKNFIISSLHNSIMYTW